MITTFQDKDAFLVVVVAMQRHATTGEAPRLEQGVVAVRLGGQGFEEVQVAAGADDLALA